MSDSLFGSCQCGEVTYELDRAAVLTLYRCHCRECQKQAAGAFGVSLKARRDGFRILRGELGTWERATDSGKRSVANFCRGCGCRIFHGAASSEIVSLKAGLLDEIAELWPVGNIWTDSALPWIDATDGIVYARQPPSYDALIEAYRRQP